MAEFRTDRDAPVVGSVAELRGYPPATVVVTADGFRYVKKQNGRWYFECAKDTPSSWLLDPEHSRQPVRVMYVPDASES